MSKFIILIIIFTSLSFINENTSEPNADISYLYQDTQSTANLTENLPIFTSQEIPNNIYENMLGKSIPLKYKDQIDISSLSYLQISYFSFDGKPYVGEMIVNSKLANEILDIFEELYYIQYPIEKIKLIDQYNADDELSMSDNNTSCFCYRAIAGTSTISNHALGTAIDINPLYNPYVVNGIVSPVSATLYANRNANQEHQISKNDKLYKIFIKHGWSWGGDWSNKKDYQHFEKNI